MSRKRRSFTPTDTCPSTTSTPSVIFAGSLSAERTVCSSVPRWLATWRRRCIRWSRWHRAMTSTSGYIWMTYSGEWQRRDRPRGTSAGPLGRCSPRIDPHLPPSRIVRPPRAGQTPPSPPPQASHRPLATPNAYADYSATNIARSLPQPFDDR